MTLAPAASLFLSACSSHRKQSPRAALRSPVPPPRPVECAFAAKSCSKNVPCPSWLPVVLRAPTNTSKTVRHDRMLVRHMEPISHFFYSDRLKLQFWDYG